MTVSGDFSHVTYSRSLVRFQHQNVLVRFRNRRSKDSLKVHEKSLRCSDDMYSALRHW